MRGLPQRFPLVDAACVLGAVIVVALSSFPMSLLWSSCRSHQFWWYFGSRCWVSTWRTYDGTHRHPACLPLSVQVAETLPTQTLKTRILIFRWRCRSLMISLLLFVVRLLSYHVGAWFHPRTKVSTGLPSFTPIPADAVVSCLTRVDLQVSVLVFPAWLSLSLVYCSSMSSCCHLHIAAKSSSLGGSSLKLICTAKHELITKFEDV